MKEFESDKKEKIEISVKQKKQIQHELSGVIVPYEGHTIWQINQDTLEIDKAKFSMATYTVGGENKKEVIMKMDSLTSPL